MSVENVDTSCGNEVACKLKEQIDVSYNNVCCSQTPVQTNNRYGSEHQRSVKNAFILGSGDTLTHEENGPGNNISVAEEKCEKFSGLVASDEQRFLSILDRRRLAKKGEEKFECKWKESTNPDDESVKQKVSDLLCRLKKQFSEMKQARKQQRVNVTDNAKHVWNNSVDSFLRHHEKPRVDIRFTERYGDQPGKGVYTFAVRPSKIRKTEKQVKTSFDEVLQNTKQDTRHVEVPVKCEIDIGKENEHHSTRGKSCDLASTPSDDVSLIRDVSGYDVPLCYKTPLILDTFYHHTITRLRNINAENIVNGTATNVRQEDVNVSQVLESNMKSLLLMYTGQRSANKYKHIHMVTPTYNAVRPEHNIRQICNTMVPGLFNVYTQSALPFYVLPTQDINGHSVPPNNCGKRFICNYSVPSYSKRLKPNIQTDNALKGTVTEALHKNTEHTSVYKSRKSALFDQGVIPICKALTVSNVSSDKDIPSDIAAWCQHISPFKNPHAMAHVYSNTEIAPSYDSTENEKLCCEEDTLHDETVTHVDVSSHKQPSPDALPSTSQVNEELTTSVGDNVTELIPNNETSYENITETSIDEFDDDSPFGILSVFCRSAIHSGYSADSEAERLCLR